MVGTRYISILVLLATITEVSAQFVPQPVYYPVPVYYPALPQSGFGIYYQSGRLRLSGFIGAPYYYAPPYAAISNQVSINVITPPTYVISSRRLIAIDDDQDVDLAGIDLDAKPLARKPGQGINGPAVAVVAKPRDIPVAAKPPAELPPAELPPPAGNVLDESIRLIKLGREAFASQLYGLAALRFRQASVATPLNAEAFRLLAQAQFALGRFRDAAATIEDGMSRDDNWSAADFALRSLYKGAEGNLDAQLKLLEDTVQRYPNDPAYRFLLAHQMWFNERRAEAGPVFQIARQFAIDPTFIDRFLRALN